MIVPVLHPARVVHVPARSRNPREDLVATRTDVEIAEVSRAETAEVGTHPRCRGDQLRDQPLQVREHGGRRWTRLPEPVGAPEWDRSADLVLAYLRGDLHPGAAAYAHLASFFVQGPVSARHVPRGDAVDAARGTPEPAVRTGKVVSDGTEPARSALRAHLADSLLLVGGEPWIRFRPLLHYSFTTHFSVRLQRLPNAGTEGLRDVERAGFAAFAAADLELAAREWGKDPTTTALHEAEMLAGLSDAGADAHALLLELNALPQRAAARMRWLVGQDRQDLGAVRPESARLLRAAEDLDRSARIGGIGPAEAHAAALALKETFAYLRGHQIHAPWTIIRADHYLERFAIPRAARVSNPSLADDATALGGFAP